MTGPDPGAKMVSASPGGVVSARDSFKIVLEKEFPGQVLRAAVQIGGSFYDAKFGGTDGKPLEFQVSPARGASQLSSLLSPGSSDHEYDYYPRNAARSLQQLRNCASMLAMRSGADPQTMNRVIGRPLPPDTVRFYAYIAAPDAFRMSGKQFATGQNFVLYLQDFVLSEKPTP
jgi:hypothetical protein